MISMNEMKCIKKIEKKKNVLQAVMFGIRTKLNLSYADIDELMGYNRGITDNMENRDFGTFKNENGKNKFYEVINKLGLDPQDFVCFEEIDTIYWPRHKKRVVLNVVSSNELEENVLVLNEERYLRSELKELLSAKEYEYLEQRFIYNKTATEASFIFGGKLTDANKSFYLIKKKLTDARGKALEIEKIKKYNFNVSLKDCVDTYAELKYKGDKNGYFKTFIYCVANLADMQFVDLAEKLGINKFQFKDLLNASNLKEHKMYGKLVEILEKDVYPVIHETEPTLSLEEFKEFF